VVTGKQSVGDFIQSFTPENFTTKRRVWRVKIVEDEEWFSSPIQEAEVIQGEIVHEVCITNEMENS
jgi:hypothetical protein